jgi:hypothetical protein
VHLPVQEYEFFVPGHRVFKVSVRTDNVQPALRHQFVEVQLPGVLVVPDGPVRPADRLMYQRGMQAEGLPMLRHDMRARPERGNVPWREGVVFNQERMPIGPQRLHAVYDYVLRAVCHHAGLRRNQHLREREEVQWPGV